MKQKILLGLLAGASWLAFNTCAEEGGSGHYAPGATADFIDTLPGKPGLVFANAYTYYDGSATPPVEFGGTPVLNANARLNAYTIFGLYETSWTLLGGNYAVAVTIPYVWLEVDGNVKVGPLQPRVHDTTDGLGDITVYPFMLGWTNAADMKYDVRLGIYTPTGSYEAGKLANAGRNYWTFEPSASFSWLSTKIGTEVTVFAGFDINTENEATHYQSGASFHLDGTAAQHFPLLGGFGGVGAEGFVYEQISPDGGSGAKLGDCEGQTIGVGPVASYTHKIGKYDFACEVKWLDELNTQKRLNGNYIWFKAGIVF
ncbi:MAG TPA: transporter [Candidatus Acidoferrum sp.]|nr:transporter [Candidatus Acidoferrum sp.]